MGDPKSSREYLLFHPKGQVQQTELLGRWDKFRIVFSFWRLTFPAMSIQFQSAKTALDFCCSLAPEVVGTLHKISIQPSGAHWLGHQVRSRHRHLRHGLLCAFEPPRQPREESQVEGGKGGRRTQVEEGPTRPGSSKYVFVSCLLVGFFWQNGLNFTYI